MTSPLVSVIVPVYNTERYLERCLESIASQTYTDLEVIIVDDGSTDRSPEICQHYVALDSRFTYHRQENQGVSAARNAGLDRATGQYVSIVDSDDWLEPDLYAVALAAIQKQAVEVLFFEYFVDTNNQIRAHREYDDSSYGTLDRRRAVRTTILSANSFAFTRIFLRSVVAETRFRTDLHWGEETVFVLQVLDKVSSAFYIPDALYHYVQSEGSATRSGFNPRRLSGILTAHAIIEFTKRDYPELEEHAHAFFGGILTELIIEVDADPDARSKHSHPLKVQLRTVTRQLLTSKNVSSKEKIKWLLAIVNPRALAKVRSWRSDRG